MSRNYEVLQRASQQQESSETLVDATIFQAPPADLDPTALSRAELTKLVQRVFLLPDQAGRKVVSFAGIRNGTGCSSICAGAGEALAAQVDKPVCLVDANLRRPALHRYFQVSNLKGLSDAVFSQDPIAHFLQKLRGGKVHLLSAGSMGSRLSSGFNAEQLRARLTELRDEFSYVLIDSPSVNSCAEALLLGKLADGIILVLESNSTRREAARIAKEIFESAGVCLLGAVLNKRTFPIPRFLYERL
ncbi:MAG: CpsD/CapB family tyrosine-protein kinase [Acidobacteriia bacterium]|nr:CpsD/CapB family tyrosine-protein kinase [Terriglobia bacterium]